MMLKGKTYQEIQQQLAVGQVVSYFLVSSCCCWHIWAGSSIPAEGGGATLTSYKPDGVPACLFRSVFHCVGSFVIPPDKNNSKFRKRSQPRLITL